MVQRTSLTINLHPAIEEFDVQQYPSTSERPWPFIAVELGGGVSLMITDVEVMAKLVKLFEQAERQLVGLTSENDRGLMVGEPVGDTGLFLHPLPVGQV